MTKITAIFKANKTEDCMCLKHHSNFMVTQVQVYCMCLKHCSNFMVTQVQVYFFIQSHVN